MTRAGSTRSDPRAQERAAREMPLLLHSMTQFGEVFEMVFAAREIREVVEVGVESGQASGGYLDMGATRVHCVDPFPTDALRAALADRDGLELVTRPSPDVLAELPVADLYVIDGDHNYAVVRAELDWIMANAPDAIVVMHDVLWPCARRDMYYQPSPLPARDRHPDTHDGPTVWQDAVSPSGFRGNGAFTFATEAGGERNGVLTALEDALAARPGEGWRFATVPAVFGLGIFARNADALFERLAPLTGSALLADLENNRIALFTKVLHLEADLRANDEEIRRLRAELDASRGIKRSARTLATAVTARVRRTVAGQR